MFIETPKSKGSSLQRSEIYGPTYFIYQYIALRWSAKQWLVARSINIWLLRSQNIVWFWHCHAVAECRISISDCSSQKTILPNAAGHADD